MTPAPSATARGEALFDEGEFFEAHEAWEERWRAATDPEERRVLQGLVQVAAACHKLVDARDAEAARRILGRALEKLENLEAGGAGEALGRFVARARRLDAALADGGEVDLATLPRFRTRRFVVIGRTASASPEFRLDDLPSTSGRLDALVRCLRAALLVSHGLRRDAVVYLVLLGGPSAPRTLRVAGASAKFVRPDERSLAVLVQKTLANAPGTARFVAVRPGGAAVADAGLEAVIDDVGPGTWYLLDEAGSDLRAAELDARDPVFVVGDHAGFDAAARDRLAALGARALSVGPSSVHAEDAIAVTSNELDRRGSA